MGKPQRTRYTIEDYLKTPEGNGFRYELFEGEFVVSPTPNFGHQYTCGQLFILLHTWAAVHGGIATGTPMSLMLASDTVLEPDLHWMSDERLAALLRDGRVWGAPELVIEVASPSTRTRDRTRKAELYARAGVEEYWIVDSRTCSVEILRRRGRRFVTHAKGTGSAVLVSSLSDALTVVPQRLFRTFEPTPAPQRRRASR